jgi:hypothetical protein
MDPAIFLIANPDPGGSRVLMTKKNTAVKLFDIFWIENCNLFILRPPERTQWLQKTSALKREHPALQNIKILYFFLYL